MATLEFIPIAEISDFYKRGWRLAQDLKQGDYAVLMSAPDNEVRSNYAIACQAATKASKAVNRRNLRKNGESAADFIKRKLALSGY